MRDMGLDISISTMWSMDRFASLEGFFLASRDLGFTGIELNHQVTPAMLEGVDLNRVNISSIHEPCPTEISIQEQARHDWLISSLDEESRRKGVAAIRRSIDLAHRLDARQVVVHAGMVAGNFPAKRYLHSVFYTDGADSATLQEIRKQMISMRAKGSRARLEAVKISMKELLEYAGQFSIRLGLENRYHYQDIPGPEELAELLELAGPDELGFVYDCGHAQALDALGFYPHQAWLEGFGNRIIEVHLHDIQGLQDHLAPGTGEIDFGEIAKSLPATALRTLEITSDQTPLLVDAGLKFLVEKGCVLWH